MNKNNIFIIGFMGSGKTTIAKKIKQITKMQFIDMDQEIVNRVGMSIPDIFKNKGEVFFRNLETNLLKEIQNKEGVVVSCGGGVVLKEENIVEMRKAGTVVLLKASPETVYRRVSQGTNRPILNGNMNRKYIKDLMKVRQEQYQRAAHIVVITDKKVVRQISQEIIELVKDWEGK